MAKKKKEIVSMDEVREEIAQAPAEAEEPGEVTEATDPEGEGETGQEESAPDEVEAEAASVSDPEDQDWEQDLTAADLGVGEEGDPIKIVRDTRLITVPLSDRELAELAKTMIDARDDAARAQRSIKALKAQSVADMEEAMERASEAEDLIRIGSEERSVECQQIHNWATKMVYTRRVDTGEIIGSREMLYHEKQMPIPGSEATTSADEEQTEIDTEAGQAEPGAKEAPEAQADSDAVDDLDFDGDSEGEGELVGVGASHHEGEI